MLPSTLPRQSIMPCRASQLLFLLRRDATVTDAALRVKVLAVDGSRETAKVHKALALRDTDDDALIVTVAVRPKHRIANLVHPTSLRSAHRRIVFDYFIRLSLSRQLLFFVPALEP